MAENMVIIWFSLHIFDIIMVIFCICPDCMHNNFLIMYLCLMLKILLVLIFQNGFKIEIWLNNVVIFFLHIVIMVIFDTGLDSMHTIFIMKYLCLILENELSYYLQNYPNVTKGPEFWNGPIFCFQTFNQFSNHFNYTFGWYNSSHV